MLVDQNSRVYTQSYQDWSLIDMFNIEEYLRKERMTYGIARLIQIYANHIKHKNIFVISVFNVMIKCSVKVFSVKKSKVNFIHTVKSHFS